MFSVFFLCCCSVSVFILFLFLFVFCRFFFSALLFFVCAFSFLLYFLTGSIGGGGIIFLGSCGLRLFIWSVLCVCGGVLGFFGGEYMI